MTIGTTVDRYCPNCGARLSATESRCPSCGSPTPQRSVRLDATEPAPASRRAFATLIDAAPVIVLLVGWLLAAAVTEMASWVTLMMPLLVLAWCLLVWVWESATGQGPGKSVLGLRVLDERTGERIGPVRTLARLAAKAGSVIGTVGVAAMSYRWDPTGREQTWWDRMGGSRVIAGSTDNAGGADGFSVLDPVAQSRWTPVPPPAAPPPFTPAVQDPTAVPGPTAVPDPTAEAPTTIVRREQIAAVDPLGEAPTVAVGRHALADTPTSEHPQSVIEDADATAARVLLPARAATVTLQWDTGSRVTVGGVVLVGRDPHPAAGEQVDRRLSVGADAIGVSKTHLALTVTTDGITVLDRHSTNGTRIERSGGEIVSCPPGEPIGVRDGDRILFGGRSIEVASA